jgi:1-acyl-sn-glycerol-3-phosphate acyltransferase
VKSNPSTIRAELGGLPPLPPWRRVVRRLLKALSQFLVWLCTRHEVYGRENFPKQGPVLIVINHLGDIDAFLGLAVAPVCIDTIAKQGLYDIPIIGTLMHAYGMIWLQRSTAYRHVLRAALDSLAEGRFVAIAPEGRESLTGALEQGMDGAAYLALKSNALLLPVTFTGTENRRIFDNLKHLRRTFIGLYYPSVQDTSPDDIRLLLAWNEGAQKIIEQEGRAIFIPTYDLFKLNVSKYVAFDALHPNSAGYQAIAYRIGKNIEGYLNGVLQTSQKKN